MTPLEFAKAELKSKTACLFTRTGYLLWRSPAWNPDHREFTPEENYCVNGTGWHEFIRHTELAPLIDWLGSSDHDSCIVFHCMHSSTGTYHRLLWRKAPLDTAHWIVLSADITELIEDTPSSHPAASIEEQ